MCPCEIVCLMKFLEDKIKEITGRQKKRTVFQHETVQNFFFFFHNKGGNMHSIIRWVQFQVE